MVDRRPLLLLPMQLTGTPIRVAQWLRAAGIPAVDFSSGAVADGRTDVSALRGPLLFDSRTPSSRADAEQAAARGWKTIDVARLLARREASDIDDSHIVLFDDAPPVPFPAYQSTEFIERLKEKVEKNNGVWIRISDYPFPCRSSVVEFEPGDNLSETVFGIDAVIKRTNDAEGEPPREITAQFREYYEAGRPALVPLSVESAAGRPADPLFQNDEYPLAWRTTPAEFSEWRRLRERCSFQLEFQENCCRIESSFSTDAFRPALEIWRGNHVATIPLSNGRMEVELSGLVFQQSSGRHPGGFAAVSCPPFFTETTPMARIAS